MENLNPGSKNSFYTPDSENPIRIYGTDGCSDCRHAQLFLDRHKLIYEWIDISLSKDAETFVIQANNGICRIPTIVFTDGSILIEPSDIELAAKIKVELK